MKRTYGFATRKLRVRPTSLDTRLLEPFAHDGVEHRVDAFDLRDVGIDDLEGGDVALLDPTGELASGCGQKFGHDCARAYTEGRAR